MQIITLKVTPNAKKNEVIEEKDIFDNIVYKVYTSQPPEDGKANKAVIDLLSEYFKKPKSKIKVTKGLTSRVKTVEIE